MHTEKSYKKILKKERMSISILILFNIVISFLSVYPTYVIGMVVDHLLSDDVVKYILLFVVLRLFYIIFKLISSYIKATIKVHLLSNTRSYSLELAMLNPNFGNFENSQYMTRIVDATDTFENALSSLISWISLSLPTVLITIYYMAKIDWLITAVLLPLAFMMVYLSMKSSKVLSKSANAELSSLSKVKDSVYDIINNIDNISIFNAFGNVLSRHEKIEDQWQKEKIRYDFRVVGYGLLISLFGVVVTASILVLSVFHSTINPGSITSLVLYSGNLFMIIQEVVSNVAVVGRFKEASRRLDDMISVKVDLKVKEINHYDITFDHLSFSYGDKRIIKELNGVIPYGSKVAIIGGNGTGKTTLVKLICGLLEPSGGKVQVGGEESRLIKNRFVSVSFQNPKLFNDTIRNNVLFFDDRVEHLIDDLFNDFEKGADTVAINSGSNFSGGQLQRISLCRALVNESFINIYDEFENSLDKKYLDYFYSNILKLKGTVIMITHRNIKNDDFDYIIDLDEEKIIHV
ncbi:ABC transporter ATP-binding protein [uncultured Traorella sp.]|uniref:ATP-binding cassette domain-containing protein n=1 Tax=uncultured Traorella sp. TaxID=1929048 RepID=UPI0025F23425|nr:ABC transporter ATP-binding protein [uncultured Traorella sp.]